MRDHFSDILLTPLSLENPVGKSLENFVGNYTFSCSDHCFKPIHINLNPKFNSIFFIVHFAEFAANMFCLLIKFVVLSFDKGFFCFVMKHFFHLQIDFKTSIEADVVK